MIGHKLSIIIPAYNEVVTLEILLGQIEDVKLIGQVEKQIIVVNDASTDDTHEFMLDYIKRHSDNSILYLRHEINKGKGSAIMTGLQAVTGSLVVIQDADLEYDPQDYNHLLAPYLAGEADVVFGSRYLKTNDQSQQLLKNYLANQLLTRFFNIVTRSSFTDVHTCYKLFPAKLIKSISLCEQRFGFDPEISAKIIRQPGIRIKEVAISYAARSRKQGKKIGWLDGFRALYCNLKYGLFKQ